MGPHFRKPLLVDVIHHYNFVIVTGRRSSRAEKRKEKNLWIKSLVQSHQCHVHLRENIRRSTLIPETAWPGSHCRRSAAFIPRDTLSAEVFGEEVQFIRRRLEGQLMQLLLWWTGWLEMKQIYIQHEKKKKTKFSLVGEKKNCCSGLSLWFLLNVFPCRSSVCVLYMRLLLGDC